MLASEFMIAKGSRVASPNLSGTIPLDESTRRIYKRFRFRFITPGTERIEREFACDGWSSSLRILEGGKYHTGIPYRSISDFLTGISLFCSHNIQYKYFLIFLLHSFFKAIFILHKCVFLHFMGKKKWVSHMSVSQKCIEKVLLFSRCIRTKVQVTVWNIKICFSSTRVRHSLYLVSD